MILFKRVGAVFIYDKPNLAHVLFSSSFLYVIVLHILNAYGIFVQLSYCSRRILRSAYFSAWHLLKQFPFKRASYLFQLRVKARPQGHFFASNQLARQMEQFTKQCLRKVHGADERTK